MANCLIGLGSNLGDRAAYLQSALDQIRTLPQTSFIARSSFRDTNPAGGPVKTPYLNAAARIDTSLTPQQLLGELQQIENSLGRVRDERWGPRTIDLDLLLYDQLELDTPKLALPHPRMSFRRFVLEPANEIAAEMIYPINGWAIRQLITHLGRGNRLIVLQSADDSKAELLRELSHLPNVRTIFRQQTSPFESRRKKTLDWLITDWIVSKALFLHGCETNQFGLGFPPNLVVIWQPEITSDLEDLYRDRRLMTSPPSLWLPGVSIEQARQEVIAAMAAME